MAAGRGQFIPLFFPKLGCFSGNQWKRCKVTATVVLCLRRLSWPCFIPRDQNTSHTNLQCNHCLLSLELPRGNVSQQWLHHYASHSSSGSDALFSQPCWQRPLQDRHLESALHLVPGCNAVGFGKCGISY